MKIFSLFMTDMLIILISTILGLVLRENFEITWQRLFELNPYFLATFVSAAIFTPIFGVSRFVWRFSAMPDYLRLTGLMTAVTIGSLAITFAINRLDGVPRSLPFLQFDIGLTFLIGLRVLYRFHLSRRHSRKVKIAPLRVVEPEVTESVLLIGLSGLTELYLKSVSELGQGRVKIAGILGHREHHVGRLVATHKVLGTPEDLKRVLSDLKFSGVAIDKLIITAPSSSFTPEAHQAIAEIEQSSAAQVINLSKKFGFEPIQQQPSLQNEASVTPMARKASAFEIRPHQLETMHRRPYWKVKRMIDIFASLGLLVVTAPIMMLIGVVCLPMIGRPILFWQQRPGLGGRPIKLYKFRTMKAAYTADGRELSDDERVSIVGNFLRRTRLDELPQLINILRGDMSFVGPRPLLPRDQDDAYRARLFVRPGLTGWAQVVGGRAISAEDKAALDVWYVKNARLSLDLKVLLKTIPLVLLGETISRDLIEQAWLDLRRTGALQSSFAHIASKHEQAAA